MKFQQIATLAEHKAAIYALCEGGETHQIFSAGSDRHVIQWDLKKLKVEAVVAKSPTTIISLAFLKRWNYLLIGQVEGGVHIIDLMKGKEFKYLKVHKGYIFDILYIEEKDELVFSSGDGSISIWSVPDFKLLNQKKLTEEKIRRIAYSSSRKELAVGLGDGRMAFLKTDDWSVLGYSDTYESAINSVCYSPNADFILAGEKDAQLHKIHLKESGKEIKLAAHYWAIYDIAFKPTSNGQLFATASKDKTVKIWDAQTMRVLKRFEGFADKGHTHSVNALLWSSYKEYLVSAGDDKSIKIWNIDS
ncbi:MAG: hypothetical protein CMO34_06670 [Verrucomicrobia bacterium]|nr:hypothetical protein [Verrucomicrobiota bacterium]